MLFLRAVAAAVLEIFFKSLICIGTDTFDDQGMCNMSSCDNGVRIVSAKFLFCKNNAVCSQVFKHFFIAPVTAEQHFFKHGSKYGILLVNKKSQNMDLCSIETAGYFNSGDYFYIQMMCGF